MGFFDNLIAAGKNLLADAEREFSRVTNRDTFQRVCQAAFLIARADGSFDPSEKATLQGVIAKKLPHFKAVDISRAIDQAAEELSFSDVGGIQMLLANIGKAKGTDEAQLIMLVALAIGGADGNFDDNEKRAAGEIADALGVSRSSYGL